MANPGVGLEVKGLRELNRTFKNAPDDVRKALRAEYRSLAEPTRAMAESLASSEISNIFPGDRWSKFRTGVTQTRVYVAPRQKGVRGRTLGQRRNLAGLLEERVTSPALERHEHQITSDMDRILDRLVRGWERGF